MFSGLHHSLEFMLLIFVFLYRFPVFVQRAQAIVLRRMIITCIKSLTVVVLWCRVRSACYNYNELIVKCSLGTIIVSYSSMM
jgi:hypothetical protein